MRLSDLDALCTCRFQQLFEVRKRKWVSYAAGEEPFGLPLTKYPELAHTEEEITMLDKLYTLYVGRCNANCCCLLHSVPLLGVALIAQRLWPAA